MEAIQDEPFAAWINFLYKNKLFDEVLTDILLTVLIIFTYLCAYAYLKVRANSNFIRENWSKYRCNPSYMPFAGMVMQPTNMSKSDYAQMNFEYCFQNIMNGVATSFMEPLYYTQSVAGSILHGIANALNSVRELINNIRNAISSVIADIMGRTLNVMQPIMHIIIKVRDVIGKMQGLVTTQLYTVYAVYLMLLSGLRTVYDIMVIILIAMGATIVAVDWSCNCDCVWTVWNSDYDCIDCHRYSAYCNIYRDSGSIGNHFGFFGKNDENQRIGSPSIASASSSLKCLGNPNNPPTQSKPPPREDG
jgi:hypothetical protein